MAVEARLQDWSKRQIATLGGRAWDLPLLHILKIRNSGDWCIVKLRCYNLLIVVQVHSHSHNLHNNAVLQIGSMPGFILWNASNIFQWRQWLYRTHSQNVLSFNRHYLAGSAGQWWASSKYWRQWMCLGQQMQDNWKKKAQVLKPI